MATPVGARMRAQAAKEGGTPIPPPTLPQLDPNDSYGAANTSATGGPNAIGRIRGSTFRDFTPVQQQQQLATAFMQSRGIPLNAQNREQVMQFLIGSDPAAQAAVAPADTMGDISAGIDAADASGGVPGPAGGVGAVPSPMARPGAPAAQQGGGFPWWIMFPAAAGGAAVVAARLRGKNGAATPAPPEGTVVKAGDSIVPLAVANQPLTPDTQVRAIGEGFEANVDGEWVAVDEPDDATVQQAVQQHYSQDTSAPPGQPDDGMNVFKGDSPEMAGGLNVFTGEDDTNVFRDTPPNEPAGDFNAFADDAASVPIGTEEVIPPSARMPVEPVAVDEPTQPVDAAPKVEVGGGKSSADRAAESKARREAAKEKRAKSGVGKAAKAVRGAKK